MSGLSLVILRQIIQDYNLMGSVKSAGRSWRPILKKYLLNAFHINIEYLISIVEWGVGGWGDVIDHYPISKGSI